MSRRKTARAPRFRDTRWRGRLAVPAHTHPLVRMLFLRMNTEMTTITEVAARAGLRRGTISDWRYNREPTVSNLDAALNVMGLRLCVKEKLT